MELGDRKSGEKQTQVGVSGEKIDSIHFLFQRRPKKESKELEQVKNELERLKQGAN